MAQQGGQISPDEKWLWNGVQWAPYQQPLTAVVPWARPYESARSRASFVTFGLAANAAAMVLVIIATVVVDLEPQKLSDSQLLAIAALSLIAFVAFAGTYVPSIVFFCVWLHRVVRNMPALGTLDPRWSPAGAVGRCFVPFLNFVHPLFGALDAWRGSDPSRRWLDLAARKAMPAPRLMVTWWALWLLGGYAGNTSSRLTGEAAAVIDVLGGAALIGAAVVAILVVRDLTARQDRRNELIASGQLV